VSLVVAPWLVIGLAVLVVVLTWALWREAGQRRELARWLEAPNSSEIPDGRGRWLEIFSALQRFRKSEQKGRATLGASLERFRQAAQALPDGVLLLDLAGRIEWMNPSAARHLGLEFDRDVGILVEQLIRSSEFFDYLERFRAGGEFPPLVLPIGEDRSRRVLSLTLIPFADEGTLLLSRDITDIARTEAMRRDFIANVSHELRTPLTVISGFLEQMTASEAIPREATETFLRLMTDQARRMTRLVEDLLTLSRLECDSEPPVSEIIDISTMMESLRAEAEALSSGKHDIQIGEMAPECLLGNADELRSAFGNLLSNAVRYTPPGGRIEISWHIDAGCPTLTVYDNGIGIPKEHIPRLTERFYRVDKGRSSSTGGTGLGLAIVKHVLVRHQGTLAIKSDIGQGSSFSAVFPAERCSGKA
jgi:two-component system phosphate regulon sensor histidine kinase PhoR